LYELYADTVNTSTQMYACATDSKSEE